MQASILSLLGFSLALAGLLFYLYVLRRESDFGGWGIAGLATILVLIVPVLLLVLWNQSEAEQRLRDIGFRPHPDFDSSVGLATGGGDNPTWVFASGAGRESILYFYRRPENHAGWSLVADNTASLAFGKAGQRVTIQAGDGQVIILLQPK